MVIPLSGRATNYTNAANKSLWKGLLFDLEETDKSVHRSPTIMDYYGYPLPFEEHGTTRTYAYGTGARMWRTPGFIDKEFTLSAWIKPSGAGDSGPVFRILKVTANFAEITLSYYPRTPSLRWSNTTGFQTSVCTGTAEAAATGWHHIAGTGDGTTITLWMDGVPVDTSSVAAHAALTGSSTPLYFAVQWMSGLDGSMVYTGDIAGCRAWDRQLTVGELQGAMERDILSERSSLNLALGTAATSFTPRWGSQATHIYGV